MNIPRLLLALALFSSPILAQRAAPPAGPAPARLPKVPALEPARSDWRLPHDRLYLSRQPDGSPQARGRTYKAEFTPGAATYIPFCGSAAPSNHPLGFRIASIRSGAADVAFEAAAVAGLAGDRVSYERGSVREVYELALDSVEQKFVFPALPTRGELALRLAVTTDMSASRSGRAIDYASADGVVRYGAATVVDARGLSAPAPSELVEQGLEIRVPAEFMARATFPITIDPVIQTYSVTWLTEPVDSFSPAVAWDETNQRYCIVYEEVFSANDHDTDSVFVSSSGVFQSGIYVDTILSSYWATPDVANSNNANNFFVVAAVGLPASGTRTIHGRTLDASSTSMTLGTDVLVSTPDQLGEMAEPSVGGDPYLSGAAYYTVVWTRMYAGDYDVHMRQVNQTGVLLGTTTILLADTPAEWDSAPRISKSCQNAGTHHVVWESMVNFGDLDIGGAEVSWNGAVNIPATQLVSGVATTTRPACSPMDAAGRWVLVYEYDFTSDHDVFGELMTGLTSGGVQNLSELESQLGGGMLFQDQVRPAVDTDGVHFACVYSEQFGSSTTDYDIRGSSLDVINGKLALGVFHDTLAASTTREDYPRMCSQQAAGGTGNQLGVVWWDNSNTGNMGNIEGAVYGTGDFTKLCTPNVAGISACPCSNTPLGFGKGCENSSFTGGASIQGVGSATLSNDTVQLVTSGQKPTASSMVMQGSALIPAGVAFGQGVRCAGGVLKRLYVKAAVGGSVLAPGGPDPLIHVRSATLGDTLTPGSLRYYFVYYRDPVILGGCPASAGFNATDTLQVVWRP